MQPTTMPTDIFPNIDIPVVSVIWTYSGMPPDAMSNRITGSFERVTTATVNNIDHIESQSLTGVAVVKFFFHRGVNVDLSLSQLTALEHAIAILTGQPPAGFSLPVRPLDVTPPEIAAVLPASLLERRPDIAAAERRAVMARAAGVDMPPTRLLESTHADHVRRHFAVKRFDRDGCERIHHHTLAAMCHIPGCDLDYQTFLRVTRRITRDEREVWRAFRRAVFNVLASNRDDHGKNHGFLYRNREWKLGPAYDVTFCSPRQLPERGMAICGERGNVGRKHLVSLAESEALDRRTALAIIDEVAAAIARWHEFAGQAKVPAALTASVALQLNVQAKV
jgi:hypothetical protein